MSEQWKVVRFRAPKDGTDVERHDRALEDVLNAHSQEGYRLYRMTDASKSKLLMFVRAQPEVEKRQ